MAYFELEDGGEILRFEKKNQIFTATLSNAPNYHIDFMDIRRKTGDRIIECLSIGGELGKELLDYYNRELGNLEMKDISFCADIDLTNIRLAEYMNLERLVKKNGK